MTLRPWALTAVLTLAGCASSRTPNGASDKPPSGPIETIRHVDRVSEEGAPPVLAGDRCPPGGKSCRCRAGDDKETTPPPAGRKRLEIRIANDGGDAVLDSATLGRFGVKGAIETCYYVDVPAGSKHSATFTATAVRPEDGMAPRVRVAEYGPKGPWWYEILSIDCTGPQGRCNRDGVNAWATRTVSQRKRGRLDPCGSFVVSQLKWESGGALADRDGGYYRDLTVRFDLEVKSFETQFAPGSTECVPK